MCWLGGQLGFDRPADWYQLRRSDFARNHGHGFLKQFAGSPIAAVRDYLPTRDWKEWLFRQVSPGFWQSEPNRIRYMKWLGRRLKFRRPEDWYRVTVRCYRENSGLGLLAIFTNSPARTVMSCFPDEDWKEWLFNTVPAGFWNKRQNRLRYLKWLEEQIGISKPDEWYQVKQSDFFQRQGTGVLRFVYRGSPGAAAKDLYPDHCWHEWLFPQVPHAFWKKRANRRRYMRWLADRIGIRRPSHWMSVTNQHFCDHGGRHLFETEYERSVHKAVRDHLPQYKWRPEAFTS